VPTPEDFPQANRLFPKTKSHLNLHQPIVPCAGSLEPAVYLPLVRSDVLQLTFRVFKVKPSDAALFATIVPFAFPRKTVAKLLELGDFVFFPYVWGAGNRYERLFSVQFPEDFVCALIGGMAVISRAEFQRIADGIFEDRELIIKHNPIGTREETLLWMLLSCLVSYLSLTDAETPCFTGRPDTETYREAIRYILREHAADDFDVEPALAKLSE
jgi:hypothetical protein